jgi:hypothetical protein
VPQSIDTVRIWNLEAYEKPQSNSDTYDVGDEYLVHGNVVQSRDELSDIAYPMIPRFHHGKTFSDWDRADSVMSASLPQLQFLADGLAQIPQNSVVLAGTDNNLWTMFEYSFGQMTLSIDEAISPVEYMRLLKIRAGYIDPKRSQ